MPPFLIALVGLLLSSVSLSGCDFLPQSGTEWGIALGIFGVLFVVVVIVAWKASRKPKP